MPEACDPRISGMLVLDKPAGPTSFDCVARARRILQEKRVGHCGTLDPMAEGVLILLFGRSTRRQQEFLDMEKQYWFRGELGRSTDSGDRTGTLLETRPVPAVSRESLQRTANKFRGEVTQIPPKVSAIKYQGKPLYKWARQGIDVPRRPRQVHIESFDILDVRDRFYEARVVCSRGTYIRTLAEDLAAALGTVGLVDALVRERVGRFRRESALSWEQLCQASRDQLLALTGLAPS